MPTARELAAFLQADLTGDPEVEVRDIGAIDTAKPGDAVFALDAKWLGAAESGPCAVVVVPRTLSSTAKTLLRVDDAKFSFACLVEKLRPVEKPVPGIHASAVVARDARVAKTASVGPFVVIETGAEVGERAVIGAGSVLGARSVVGPDTVVSANVSIYRDCVIGARCLLHASVVIGSDGFGFAQDKDGRHRKFPQVGNVVVGDDVEIGASTAIDRASLGSTTIGDGTKIDNLVHIAHNCRIGKHVIIASQAGLSGSVEVGDHAILLGQTGYHGHIRIGARAVVLPQSGVPSDVPDGQMVFGSPAIPRLEREKVWAASRKLPELLKRVRAIEKKLGLRGE
ncbi:MAG: UDP-3-O-(3-hydroxymyristoyl)glucosamine N-acyltransferase [Planctomycetes bacterium]|nr:UDP-3-O-(3-hydroxymyristoyl)glucosamine N-acyltransferase [Planctomycetota bacterium]